MDSPLPESPIVLGTVPYLNVQPITWALEQGLLAPGQVQIQSAVPRQLATGLRAGKYHAAIVPVFEYISNPLQYSYLNAPVIAAHGQVLSVVLNASAPWETLHTIYLDASSYTSVNLFRVLTAEKNLHPQFIDTTQEAPPSPLPPRTGWVVIGDPAITEIGRHLYTYDLATEWEKLTGLPFVFAAWIAPRHIHLPGLEELLNQSLQIGHQNLRRLIRDSAQRFNLTPRFVAQYFSRYIHYHLGPQELEGWNRFAQYCVKHQLVTQTPEFHPYMGTN